ncbi:MAG: mechanosensitive ion channel family protein [Acidobacteria bacterium]|nr:mechanosensitive ion channel family protein [Acidobacteriota bacterium]
MIQPRLAALDPVVADAKRFDHFLHWMDQHGWTLLQHLGMVLLVCVLFLWAVKLTARIIRRAVDDGNAETTSDAERRAETLGSVLMNAAWVLVVIFFLLMTMEELGINIAPLLAGAGIAGLAIGFGGQALVKDVITGFFMLMENQYGVGDIISVDDTHTGEVERMTLRITVLRDGEGRAHFIPNGTITRVVVLSKSYAKALVDIGVSYDADVDQAMAELRTLGEQLAKDWPGKVMEPTEVLGIQALADSSVTIRTLTKTFPGKQWEVGRELRRRVFNAFKEKGIEIPFPQMVVHQKER